MIIVISGATGFVGHAVARALVLEGHELRVLTRDPGRARRSFPFPAEFHSWNPEAGPAPVEALRGADAVINLAGEPIAEGRWTRAKKARIRNSRVLGTRHLLATLSELGASGPKTVVNASATGIYGDRGDDELTEDSRHGTDYLAQVCVEWEKELFTPVLPDVRRVALRIGVVLGRGGGALEKLIPVFRSAAGGKLGTGRQWMSWIHVEDLSRAVLHVLSNAACEGPVNATSPEPVRNIGFTRALAAAIGRPAVAAVPGSVLRLAVGGVADALLGGQRALPARLLESGFAFAHGPLHDALESLAPRDEELLAEQWIPASLDSLWSFFSDARNLESITPPWLRFRTTAVSTAELGEGTLIDYRLRIRGLPVRWRTRIEEWRPGRSFVDTQLQGPYARWHHTHFFQEVKGGTLITDRVRYRLPMGWLGEVAAGWMVRRDVARIFAYRREVISKRFTPR